MTPSLLWSTEVNEVESVDEQKPLSQLSRQAYS
jgi:hypothetical protein